MLNITVIPSELEKPFKILSSHKGQIDPAPLGFGSLFKEALIQVSGRLEEELMKGELKCGGQSFSRPMMVWAPTGREDGGTETCKSTYQSLCFRSVFRCPYFDRV